MAHRFWHRRDVGRSRSRPLGNVARGALLAVAVASLSAVPLVTTMSGADLSATSRGTTAATAGGSSTQTAAPRSGVSGDRTGSPAGPASPATASGTSPALANEGGGAWAPQPATYSVGTELDQPVTMSDGTVLRADVYYPTDRSDGRPAPGPFPVLLQQTPYGKQNIANATASALANTDVSYFAERGFEVVIADVRGTGNSGGTWGLFDPVQATDGATLARWAARLPHSDGRVGLFGESYMGINQFLTVSALAQDSPVKAMFPVISGNDLYRDTVTQGGLLDAEFSSFYLALVGGLNGVNPVIDPLEDEGSGAGASAASALGVVPPVELAHTNSLLQYDLPTVLSIETSGDEAFDQSYWAQRSPLDVLEKVVADQIPAFLVGGWNDLFQRGELLNYSGLQNAYSGRPLLAPMSANQPVTARYQLMMGPWEHVTTGTGVNLSQIELEWFDTWLLGQDTALAHTRTPMHLYELNADHWVDTDRWPLTQAEATKYYFSPGRTGSDALSANDGALTTTAPAGASEGDTEVFTGASSACDVQTDQWSAGLLALASKSIGVEDPCDANDSTLGVGPGALTYTTAPFSEPQTLAGPIDATVIASASTTDVELVATVEEVSPSGDSVPLTSGALLGWYRELDPADTWNGSDGSPVLPYHPYTSASARPVVPGEPTRYDIEVFPTFAEVPAGWRLRVTLTTSDTPHLTPTLEQLPGLLGGVYQILRNSSDASFVNLPLVPAPGVGVPCDVCS